MIEQVYHLVQADTKTIDKVLMDEDIHYMHVILGEGDTLPEHFSNAKIYMTVLRGVISIALGEQPTAEYGSGTMLKIPFDTKMKIGNFHAEPLEFTIIKAPAPQA